MKERILGKSKEKIKTLKKFFCFKFPNFFLVTMELSEQIFNPFYSSYYFTNQTNNRENVFVYTKRTLNELKKVKKKIKIKDFDLLISYNKFTD
jgi:hypothetical protein